MSVETATPETAARDFEVQSTLHKIQEKTKETVFIKDEKKEPAEEKANEVYAGLMAKIGEVSQLAANKAFSGEEPAYLEFLKDMKHVANVSRALAEDEVPFEIDPSYERKRGQENDEVYSYKAKGANIAGEVYDVDLMIRPTRFEALVKEGAREALISRQPRLNLHLRPVHRDESEVSIRLDPGSQVTFDLDLPSIDQIDLREAGQEAGHHFRSGFALSPEEMAQVLRAINTKVQYGMMAKKRN